MKNLFFTLFLFLCLAFPCCKEKAKTNASEKKEEAKISFNAKSIKYQILATAAVFDTAQKFIIGSPYKGETAEFIKENRLLNLDSLKTTTALSTTFTDILETDSIGILNLLQSEIYAENLALIVGHVLELGEGVKGGKQKFNVYPRSILKDDVNVAAEIKAPINANSTEIKATKTDVINLGLSFLDANISNDQFYLFTENTKLNLNLNEREIDSTKLKSYACTDLNTCNEYVIDWANIVEIHTEKYKKADKKVKVKNLPPFISAVINGGDFAVMNEESDKRTIYKLHIHIVPIRFYLK